MDLAQAELACSVLGAVLGVGAGLVLVHELWASFRNLPLQDVEGVKVALEEVISGATEIAAGDPATAGDALSEARSTLRATDLHETTQRSREHREASRFSGRVRVGLWMLGLAGAFQVAAALCDYYASPQAPAAPSPGGTK